jgi:hypothetical protein
MSLGPSAYTKQQHRIVLRNAAGVALRFDVHVDFEAIAIVLHQRALGNRTLKATSMLGAVRVEYVP